MPHSTSTRRTTRRERKTLRDRLAWTNAMIHAAMMDHSARVLQRAVRRSGLLDHGFVLV